VTGSPWSGNVYWTSLKNEALALFGRDSGRALGESMIDPMNIPQSLMRITYETVRIYFVWGAINWVFRKTFKPKADK
jgi:hypothetical protein